MCGETGRSGRESGQPVLMFEARVDWIEARLMFEARVDCIEARFDVRGQI